jgi:hypothetical protein
VAVPTRAQVLERYRSAGGYPAAARSLGVPPGLAYMIATGIPADGSDTIAPQDTEREGFLHGSTQGMANPPHHNPTRDEATVAWVRARALADEEMQLARRRRSR